MHRLRILVPGLAVLMLACSLLHGDDKKPAGKAGDSSAKRMPLPPRWSKLGLSDEQKLKVRTIRGDYAARIEALRQQISQLQKEERTALYKVLTDGQKTRLRELTSTEPEPEDKISKSKSSGGK
jgi:hypothetical protein